MALGDQFVIYLYSYIPAVLLALFFWWLDRFEREPLWLLAAAFLWGAFGAGFLSGFWNGFLHFLLETYEANAANDTLVSVIVAPTVEEFTKGVFLLFVMWVGRGMKSLTDGILLGIAVGLGFAASENVYYAIDEVYPVSGELAMWNNLWFREMHTTVLHASATAVWGAMIGHARCIRGAARAFAVCNGFVLATATHGFWNFLAGFAGSFESRFNLVEAVMRLEIAVIFALLLVLFVYSVVKESGIVAEELSEESANGVLPEEHVAYFASLVRRPARHILPAGLSPRAYAGLGVRLAFLKRLHRLRPEKGVFEELTVLRASLSAAVGSRPGTPFA